MIHATILMNGTIRLVLEGDSEIDKSVLSKLDGAVCRVVKGNLSLMDKNVSGGILIEMEKKAEIVDAPVQEETEPEPDAGDTEN